MSQSEKWNKRFLKLAHEVASWSKDDSTKVGAVIIDDKRKPKSFGYNGFPRGVDDTISSRHDRPNKYLYTVHAERNAIYNADTSLDGCTIYVTHFPCAGCVGALIQNGIETVVIDAANSDESELADRWGADFEASIEMMHDAGIKLIKVNLDD